MLLNQQKFTHLTTTTENIVGVIFLLHLFLVSKPSEPRPKFRKNLDPFQPPDLSKYEPFKSPKLQTHELGFTQHYTLFT